MEEVILADLYYRVLRDFQFSISGHKDIEDITNSFFENLSQSNYFTKSSTPFTLLLGGVLKVTDTYTWELKTFESFYFNDLKNNNQVETLSFYYFLNYLEGKREGTSKVLSQLFGSIIDFRVVVKDDATPTVNYFTQTHVVQITVPQSVIHSDFLGNIDSEVFKRNFRLCLQEIFGDEQEHLITQINKDNPHNIIVNEAVFSDQKILQKYESVMRKVFDSTKLESVRKDILHELKHLYETHGDLFMEMTPEEADYLLRELVISTIALTFLCVYFQSKIEYMMSVGKVEERKDGSRKYRNIGGVIVGYHKKHELKLEDRVMLNIISDRLTAIVSGDYLNTKLTKETEEILDLWDERTKVAYQEKLSNSKEFTILQDFIKKESDYIWSKFNDKIESELMPNKNNPTFFTNTYRPLEDSLIDSSKIHKSEKPRLEEFLIGRRLVLACIQKFANIEDGEFFAYMLIRNKQYHYAARKGNINSLRSEYCFPFRTFFGANYPQLAEEREWLESIFPKLG